MELVSLSLHTKERLCENIMRKQPSTSQKELSAETDRDLRFQPPKLWEIHFCCLGSLACGSYDSCIWCSLNFPLNKLQHLSGSPINNELNKIWKQIDFILVYENHDFILKTKILLWPSNHSANVCWYLPWPRHCADGWENEDKFNIVHVFKDLVV